MSSILKTVLALVMILIGGVKIVLHMTAAQSLLVETCGGRLLSIPLDQTGLLTSAHCWGCYMAVSGVALLALVVWERYATPPGRQLQAD